MKRSKPELRETRQSRLRKYLVAPFLDLAWTPLANSYLATDKALVSEKTFPLVVAYCNFRYLVQHLVCGKLRRGV